ncbi:MAG: heme-binding protein [Pseudomonadota bacterium]
MAVLATFASAETYKGYEMPPFQVFEARQAYEIRDYSPHILATVEIEGSLQSAASTGFRALAGYIFGGNATGEKIAMTVPVSQIPEGDRFSVSFMIPSKYDLASLPTPKDARITFETTEAERLAASQFSGYATGAVLRRRAAELRDILNRDGITIIDGPRYAYYDDPFTLPWRRRNEVAFAIAD